MSLSERLASLPPEKLDLVMQRLRATRAQPERIPRRPDDGRPVPASFAQERLWFLEKLQPGTAAYHLPLSYRLRGVRLDQGVLQRCLDELVRRHESLRTRFGVVDGRPMQIIEPPRPVPLQRIDLRSLPKERREADLARLSELEVQRRFDLLHGPLLRAALLALGDDDHLLLLTMHHILCDGWSLAILDRELRELYEAFTAGRPSPLVDLPIQYADVALWQRQTLGGDKLARLSRYWRAQLEGAPARSSLPTDRPRPAVQTLVGAVHDFAVPLGLTQALRAFGQAENATLFMVLLALFKALLQRYSNEDDIVVGTAIANRTRAEVENVVGFFVNTLVLRTRLDGEPSFRELVRRVREVTLSAYAHQDMPFERLVEELQPDRDLSHQPLVQVAFGLQTLPASVPTHQASEPPASSSSDGTAKFDLSLILVETAGGLRGVVEYNRDLFVPATIERMVRHYLGLLAAAMRDPDAPVWAPLLDDEEPSRMAEAARGPRLPIPTQTLLERIAGHAGRDPEWPAFLRDDRSWSYGELVRRAGAIRRALLARALPPEARVAVCLEPSFELAASFIAILSAGLVYLPLDPAYPPARLRFIADDAKAALLIAERGLAAELLPASQTLWIGEIADSDGAGDADVVPVAPEQLAYAIYTSGSTGRPKGVLLTHRGLANLVLAQTQLFALQPSDRVLQFASLSFDASVYELTMTLAAGATLVAATRDEMLPGPGLLRLLRERSITALTLPPSALAALPDAPLPDLRLLLTAGEPCRADLVMRWAPGRTFYNGYGPTEATVWATVARCEDDRPPPIGAPLPNVDAHVLDRHLRPLPVGIPGELYIGGAGVARGYHDRPALTAERFVPDPFSDEPGARLYRSGDLVRRLPDGGLQFLGRIDQQVKIRGFRIEPGEIEHALAQIPGVAAAAVLVRGREPSLRLVAYVARRGEAPLSGDALRAALQARLPAYMVPAAIVVLDRMPTTANGKIDHRALPSDDELRPGGEPPATAMEVQLASVWREVLQTAAPVSRRDNFFELGGHSLLVAQVAARLRDALGFEAPLRLFFEKPVLAELARALVTLVTPGAAAVEGPIMPLPRGASPQPSPRVG